MIRAPSALSPSGQDRVCDAESADRHLAARATAALRALLLLVLFIGTHVGAYHPTTPSFDIVWAVAATYATVILAATWLRPQTKPPHAAGLLIDLLLITALAVSSGRAFPQIRAVFIVAPIAAAIRLTPRRTAAMSAIMTAAYILVARVHPIHQHATLVAVLAHSLFVVWSGLAAILTSTLRERREQRILELAHARGRLVAQILDSEDRVRKDISDLLHDHAIQNLLTARQDLAEARSGDQAALDQAEHAIDLALEQLRDTIQDLDPYLLDHLDLQTAIRDIAERAARHADHRLEIDVQPATSGIHDALIVSLTRELLSNATKHANASTVRLDLTRHSDRITLEISDDGRGFSPAQAFAALRAGHIGLAAAQERLEAIGGSLHIHSTPNDGTRIRCLLPATAPRAQPADPRA